MDETTILARSNDATFEIVDGEAVIIDVESGTYYALNDTGTAFWQMLDGQKSIKEHAVNMAETYDVDIDLVIADFIELADEMAAAELVDVIDTRDVA